MGRRGRNAASGSGVLGGTGAREALERVWNGRCAWRPEWARMVTSEGASREPFHRWIPYAQGFSPELVRTFLRETAAGRARRAPLLDPFSGSGTVVTECARANVRASGVEAVEALGFLCSMMAERELPPFPPIHDDETWESIAERLERPIHRAALMLAVGRRHTSAGKVNRGARPLVALLAEVVAMMGEDLQVPLPVCNPMHAGDARRLEMFNAEAIGGILTSPPYLSRHDYTRITRPYEAVYRHWYPPRAGVNSGVRQVRAHPGGRSRREDPAAEHPAVAEVCDALRDSGERRMAGLAAAYFADLSLVLAECFRVLRHGGVCWLVIGGARLKGVYVPADLIAAELAGGAGFRVRELRVARTLIDVGRKLGGLGNVAPRESVVVMHKE